MFGVGTWVKTSVGGKMFRSSQWVQIEMASPEMHPEVLEARAKKGASRAGDFDVDANDGSDFRQRLRGELKVEAFETSARSKGVDIFRLVRRKMCRKVVQGETLVIAPRQRTSAEPRACSSLYRLSCVLALVSEPNVST